MDKARLRQAILERLQAELENLTRAALMARDEATHEESKPENQYDMHAQEAAYLAEGQARLATELNDSINLYRGLEMPAAPNMPITIGSVVTVESAGRRLRYFFGPRNGGLEVDCEGATLVVITPQSPLGRLLFGRRAGETVISPGAGKTVSQRIVSVE